MIAPTRAQVEAQVQGVLRKLPDARRIGLRAGRWTGETHLELATDGGPLRLELVPCRSVLELRERLAEPEPESTANSETDTVRVFLADLAPNELGADVTSRLAKGQLIELDRWLAVRELFQARQLDPRVKREDWMAEALLEWAPPKGYLPVVGGVLDEGTARRAILHEVLGLGPESPTRGSLWQWLCTEEAQERWRTAPEPLKRCVAGWWRPSTGEVAQVARALLDGDRAEHALALGLLVEQLGERARWRLTERYLAGETLSEAAYEQWSQAVLEAMEELQAEQNRAELREVGDRMEILWAELEDPAHEAESRAIQNDWLPSAFELRLDRVREALEGVLDGGSPDALRAAEAAARKLRAHRAGDSSRCDVLDAALALMRRESARPETGPNLASSILAYADDGSWADAARRRLSSGDSDPRMSSLCQRVLELATERREAENRRFGERIRDAGAAVPEHARLAGLESVIDRWLVPLAEQERVLLLVLDGLGQLVWRDLRPGLLDAGWQEWVSEPGGRAQALALLPTETQSCRTSLLCGKPASGTSVDERKGFEGHPAWTARSLRAAYVAPGSLRQSRALPDEVVQLIHGPARVVAVVSADVDAHFESGSDLREPFSVETLGSLSRLLEEAEASDRWLMVTGDHGQVHGSGLERRLVEVDAEVGDGRFGARHRSAEGPTRAEEGEVEVAGRRVISGSEGPGAGGKVIVPWSEKLRYRRAGRAGYHGGATPQEMVVPVSVLGRVGRRLEGWLTLEQDAAPPWWSAPEPPAFRAETEPAKTGGSGTEAPERRRRAETGRRRSSAKKPTDSRQLSLLGPTEPEAAAEQSEKQASRPWLEALFQSQVYAQQLSLVGRRPPSNDQVRRLLATLDGEGGRLTRAALAHRLQTHRLHGLLSQVGRLLNVDGFSVITVDEASDAVTFDRQLLCRQFELDAEE